MYSLPDYDEHSLINLKNIATFILYLSASNKQPQMTENANILNRMKHIVGEWLFKKAWI